MFLDVDVFTKPTQVASLYCCLQIYDVRKAAKQNAGGLIPSFPRSDQSTFQLGLLSTRSSVRYVAMANDKTTVSSHPPIRQFTDLAI